MHGCFKYKVIERISVWIYSSGSEVTESRSNTKFISSYCKLSLPDAVYSYPSLLWYPHTAESCPPSPSSPLSNPHSANRFRLPFSPPLPRSAQSQRLNASQQACVWQPLWAHQGTRADQRTRQCLSRRADPGRGNFLQRQGFGGAGAEGYRGGQGP